MKRKDFKDRAVFEFKNGPLYGTFIVQYDGCFISVFEYSKLINKPTNHVAYIEELNIKENYFIFYKYVLNCYLRKKVYFKDLELIQTN